jgi:divalent metal cation (Fe/Co/Zn/Cd) transporter
VSRRNEHEATRKTVIIGRAASPEIERAIREEIESRPGVDTLLELLTMHVGPDGLIVAARVALSDELGADEAEDLADEVDRRLSESLPLQPYVFIDPTQTRQAESANQSPVTYLGESARDRSDRAWWCRIRE